MRTGPGLRERKKAATRQAIHDAALRLAMEFGPDQVTVEAIADAAEVSRRTFSNYFGSKEEALLYGEQVRTRQLIDLVRTRPTSETAWTALTRAADEWYQRIGDRDQQWLAQSRLIRRHPSLLAHQIAAYAAMEKELASEVARRLPAPAAEPMRARLIAATFVTSLRVATHTWVEQQPDGRSLTELIHQALKVTASQFD